MKKIILLAILSVFLFGCQKSKITQEVIKDDVWVKVNGWEYSTKKALFLVTSVRYNYVVIHESKDRIGKNIDSVKCARYNEAKEILDKIKRIENLKCN